MVICFDQCGAAQAFVSRIFRPTNFA
jgi:hypothetical protein